MLSASAHEMYAKQACDEGHGLALRERTAACDRIGTPCP